MSEISVGMIVAIVVIAGAVLLFGQFAYWTWQARQEESQRELARRIGTLQEQEAIPIIRMGEKKDEPRGIAVELESLIVQAGSPYTISTLFRRIVIAAIVGVGAMLLLKFGFASIIGVGAGYLPVFVLRWQADSRLYKMTEQLPDALDLLARSLQAGHGISEGMRTVAEELPEPIGPEFGRVFEEHNLGRDLRDAFMNLARRYPKSFDIKLFASSVLLQRDTGGNLVEILQGIANTIRGRFVFQGKVGALTSEARFTGFILGGLPFCVIGLLMIMSPDYLKPLVNDTLGRMLALACMCSFSLGVYLMREVSKVEV